MNQDPNMMNQSQNMVNGQTIMNGMNQGVETVPVQVNPVMDQQQQPVQMDKDQLTRTQVLNINDVEQTAQQERHNTNIKKLGFFVFAIAVILITGGVSYQMLGIGVPEKATPATTPSTEPTSSPNAIDTTPTGPYCRLDIPQDADGTDKVFTYTLNYEGDLLKGYTKNINISQTEGNADGVTTVDNYTSEYSSYTSTQFNGYVLGVTPTNNNNLVGVQIDANVDLTTLDQSVLVEPFISNEYIKVDLQLDQPKADVTAYLQGLGYTCVE